MDNGLQIQVQILSLDGKPHPAEMERLSQFLMAGVELGVKQLDTQVMAFDPQTGEPVFQVPFLDTEAAQLIAMMGVHSPAAVLNILQNIDDGDYLHVEPIFVDLGGVGDNE